MERYEVKLECHQFLEHRCSLPRRGTESYQALQQVRVENGRLPINIRWFLAHERDEVQVLQGALEQCMLGLKVKSRIPMEKGDEEGKSLVRTNLGILIQVLTPFPYQYLPYQNALPETIQRFERLEPSEDGTQGRRKKRIRTPPLFV